jgi:hypothetical protein
MHGTVRLSLSLTLAALVGCSPPTPAPVAVQAVSSAPVTEVNWETARSAPVGDLVRLTFLPVGEDLVEVSRPGPPLPLTEEQVPVTRLSFATRAHQSGSFGLCKATVVVVPVNRTANERRGMFAAYPVYKVVGDTGQDAASEWSDAYEEQLERKCASAGRVLATNEDDYSGERFFEADIDEPWQIRFATHALQMAIVLALRSSSSVACAYPSQDPELNCAAPARRLATLKLGQLDHVSMRPCVSRPGWQCIEAKFLGDWVVQLEAFIPDMHSGTDVGALNKITISLQRSIS